MPQYSIVSSALTVTATRPRRWPRSVPNESSKSCPLPLVCLGAMLAPRRGISPLVLHTRNTPKGLERESVVRL